MFLAFSVGITHVFLFIWPIFIDSEIKAQMECGSEIVESTKEAQVSAHCPDYVVLQQDIGCLE